MLFPIALHRESGHQKVVELRSCRTVSFSCRVEGEVGSHPFGSDDFFDAVLGMATWWRLEPFFALHACKCHLLFVVLYVSLGTSTTLCR